MKTKINFLIAACTIIILLQSCLKEGHPYSYPITEDKLLLSKVTGHNLNIAWNNFEFTRNATTSLYDYYTTYSYKKEYFGSDDFKALQQVAFQNTGSWDFTYQNYLPYKTIDHSTPALDQGYWKYYYNNKGQLIKTGLAFISTAEPTEFEFYGYDDHNNLTDLVFGPAVDTALFKITYTYDANDNLIQWNYLYPIGYTNAAPEIGQRIFSSLANSPKADAVMGKNRAEMFRKLMAKVTTREIASKNSSFKIPPTRLTGDSDVIYLRFFIAIITNDGKVNPYHQQGGILFYSANREYTIDLNAFYCPLQKSNPLKTELTIDPSIGYGDLPPMTLNFTYTYNRQGYPVTSHVDASDPTGIWSPRTSYTEDRQFEYISNH